MIRVIPVPPAYRSTLIHVEPPGVGTRWEILLMAAPGDDVYAMLARLTGQALGMIDWFALLLRRMVDDATAEAGRLREASKVDPKDLRRTIDL